MPTWETNDNAPKELKIINANNGYVIQWNYQTWVAIDLKELKQIVGYLLKPRAE